MDPVSLTYFLDFVSTSGSPKLTVVRKFKIKDPYDPRQDFWKRLREGIVEFHKSGQTNKNWLDRLAKGLTDQKKLGLYPDNVKQYKRFLGRKKIRWFKPPKADWTCNGLTITVNPELGLKIDGSPTLVKLYFKADNLAKRRVEVIQLLMDVAVNKRFHFGVLDVPRAKLYSSSSPDHSLLPLLQGEAASFRAMFSAA